MAEENIYDYTNQWGTTYQLRFSTSSYADNGVLAVIADCFDEDMGCWVPYATVTVNLGDSEAFMRGDNFSFIDENNLPGFTDWLEEHGLAFRTEDNYEGQSGFCTYPLVEFDESFLAACDGEEW